MRVNYPPPFSGLSNEYSNRDLDTVYQNLTGKMMLVIATFSVTRASNAGGSYAFAKGYVGTQSDPSSVGTNIQAHVGLGNKASDADASRETVILMVPPNYYYEIDSDLLNGGALSKGSWMELT